MEILHFMGLSLLLGSLIIIDLRMAGFFKYVDITATGKFLPVAFSGFGLNFITGVLFFIGDPTRYIINIGFQIKMALVVIAGINALWYYWKIHPDIHTWDPHGNTPVSAKTTAVLSLCLWTGVLLCGRLIPYVGTG
jgi:hypothetical protein